MLCLLWFQMHHTWEQILEGQMIILLGLQVGIFLTKVQLKSEASAQSGAGFVL